MDRESATILMAEAAKNVAESGQFDPAGTVKIGLLLLPQAPASVVTGLIDFFRLVGLDDRGRRIAEPCTIETLAFSAEPLPLSSGVTMIPDQLARDAEGLDLVLVPAIGPDVHTVRRRFGVEVAWLREAARSSTRLASVCTGAFVLGETGLLNGRSATTHWLFGRTFRRRFPEVKLELDRLVVDAGQFLSSGGSNSFYDLALYIVEQNLGREMAMTVARHLLLDTDRVVQTPFMAFSPQKRHGDQIITAAQQIMETEYRTSLSIEQLAARLGLSDRSLKRRFKQATGDSPIVYLQRLRVEDARRRLSETDESVEEISYAVGYESVGFFRTVFKRHTGAGPQNYRKNQQRLRKLAAR